MRIFQNLNKDKKNTTQYSEKKAPDAIDFTENIETTNLLLT